MNNIKIFDHVYIVNKNQKSFTCSCGCDSKIIIPHFYPGLEPYKVIGIIGHDNGRVIYRLEHATLPRSMVLMLEEKDIFKTLEDATQAADRLNFRHEFKVKDETEI